MCSAISCSTTTMAEHSYPCLVLAGPSGSGRRLIRKRLLEENPMFAGWYVVLCCALHWPMFDASRAEGPAHSSVYTAMAGVLTLHCVRCRPWGPRHSPAHTTRPQEDEEVNGSDYIFCSNSEFRDLVEQGAFLQTSQ